MLDYFRYAALLLASFLLASCATPVTVESNVSRFDSLPSNVAGSTFAFVPLDSQEGSAEYHSYTRKIANYLRREGMTESRDPETADYAILFDYGVGGSRVESGSVPLYGQTGGGMTTHSGSVSSYGSSGYDQGSYSGTSYTAPTYGIIGSMPYSQTVYDRHLLVRLIDLEKSTEDNLVPAYEGQVHSSGSSPSFSMVADCMIRALFDEFRKSGSERVSLVQDSCSTQ